MSLAADLEFERIDQALERAVSTAAAAESHGMLCGMLCAAGQVDSGVWIDQVLQGADTGELPAWECRQVLSYLYDATVRGLNDPMLDFQLLLPSDGEPLAARVRALGEWCVGFLAGFGLSATTAAAAVPEDVREILGDLTEISRINMKVNEGEAQEETAYAEVVEYVRMGVVLINDELRLEPASPRLQ